MAGKGKAALAAAKDHLADTESGASPVIERMERMIEDAELDDQHLVASIRDFLLDVIKARPKPWSETPQAEQNDLAAACEHAGVELLRKVLEAVASGGREPIRALVTKVTLGDDIVISLKAKPFSAEETDAAVMALHRAHGKHVMITVASVDDYKGGPAAATDADAPELGFEAGSDHPDDHTDLADAGEPEAVEFELSIIQADTLRDAIAHDLSDGNEDKGAQDAWWKATADALGVDVDTLTIPVDIPDEGVFTVTGKPIAADAAAES